MEMSPRVCLIKVWWFRPGGFAVCSSVGTLCSLSRIIIGFLTDSSSGGFLKKRFVNFRGGNLFMNCGSIRIASIIVSFLLLSASSGGRTKSGCGGHNQLQRKCSHGLRIASKLQRKMRTPACIGITVILSMPFVSYQVAAASPIVSIQSNLPSEKALDIIFLPEDYTEEEMGNFRQTVQTYCSELFSVEPFAEFNKSINVWRIDTTEDFGASRSQTIDRLLTVNATKVKQYVGALGNFDLRSSFPNDLVIVLVNTQTYGGSGSPDIAVSYVGDEWGKEVMMHELGHSFGGLGEEYVLYNSDYPAGGNIPYPNVDWDGSKWQGIPGTGAFQGAWYRNLVRPTDTSCLMATSHWGYCPVCERALRLALQSFGLGQYYLKVGQVLGNGEVLVNGTAYREQNWTFSPGDIANVTAVPTYGWSFVAWSSFGGASDNPSYFIMYENKTVTPLFMEATNPTPTPTPTTDPTQPPAQTTSPTTTPTQTPITNTPKPTAASLSPSAAASPTPSVPEIGGCIVVLLLIFGILTAMLLMLKRASSSTRVTAV